MITDVGGLVGDYSKINKNLFSAKKYFEDLIAEMVEFDFKSTKYCER